MRNLPEILLFAYSFGRYIGFHLCAIPDDAVSVILIWNWTLHPVDSLCTQSMIWYYSFSGTCWHERIPSGIWIGIRFCVRFLPPCLTTLRLSRYLWCTLGCNVFHPNLRKASSQPAWAAVLILPARLISASMWVMIMNAVLTTTYFWLCPALISNVTLLAV